MEDSNSFSSLLALVDSHLSKSNIQQDVSQPSTSGLLFRPPSLHGNRGLSDTVIPSTSRLRPRLGFPYTSGIGPRPVITPLAGLVPGSGYTSPSGPSSMSGLPSTCTAALASMPGVPSTSGLGRKFQIPSLSNSEHMVNNVLSKKLSNMFNEKSSDDDDDDSSEEQSVPARDNSINNVVALQLDNMFKAKYAKEDAERRRHEIEKNMQQLKLEESNNLIDLMPAVQRPGEAILPQNVEIPSSGSSMESVAMLDDDDDDEPQQRKSNNDMRARSVSPMKPITRDMKYVLKHRIGRCSQFGKVLCARYRPVVAPYFRIEVPKHNINMFDFSTPSPDDIVMDRLRRPTYYNNSNNALSVYD